ncbi:DENN domain-containing protein 5A-like isoform X3 [Mya arenaria]|uniref:DENN domain-containing protein 5A-like isoform X3 n=1 Tax=Mya arenaria TaxID=6604 RepID=UPI0022E1E8D8|nr:DENN domain-containing protein 5A-like isoform X3 [Mya arenaria]
MSGPKIDQRFADYFVIAGLDVTSGLEPDLLSGEHLQCPPLQRPYKSRVLANYPDSLPWNPIDRDAVGMLCLPKGLSFRTERQCHKPQFHSFIITREDGSKLYGSSYIFFEEVTNVQICAAMQTLQHMYEAERGGGLITSITSTQSLQEPLLDHSPLLDDRDIDTTESYDIKTDRLYVTKSICLISQVQFVSAPRTFLKQLAESVHKPIANQLPLEAYIYNQLYDVPMPPPGRSMKFYGVTSPIFCQRPMDWNDIKGTGELPLFDFSLWDLVRLLGLDHLVQLLVSVLLEHQILLFSSDYHRLMLVAESMVTLVFPFSWQHVYVPILPASLQHFLDAPVPYIMGLHHGEDDMDKPQLPNEANLCFVDIDNNTVEVPEDLPAFPFEQELKEELYQAIVSSKERMLKETFTDSVISSPKRRPNPRQLSNTNADVELSMRKNYSSPGLEKMEILQQSEAWSKISAIAKKTGVWNKDFGTYEMEVSPKLAKEEEAKEKFTDSSKMPARELEELKFNNAIREIFLNRFVNMFCWYEEFVILNSQDLDSWLTNRESMQNFDKASFLSDQPESYLPFMSPFLETQMFASLIDNKIISNWEDSDASLKVFESRVKTLKEGLDISSHRSQTYLPCSKLKDTEILIEKRSNYIDHIGKKPGLPEDVTPPPELQLGFFPILVKDILNSEANIKPKMDSAKWRRKDRLLQQSEHLKLNSRQRELSLQGSVAKQTWLSTRTIESHDPDDYCEHEDTKTVVNLSYCDDHKFLAEARSKLVQPRLTEMAAGGMAQTNWKFVETLLKECKTKTKRMLVEKMGQEAVELGHSEGNLTGVEENTLIASLCDLLERIWSHGLQTKKGKSALWSHVLNFVEIEEGNEGKPVNPDLLSPVLVPTGLKSQTTNIRRSRSLADLNSSLTDIYATLCNLSSMALPEGEKTPRRGHRRTGSRGNIELPALKPLPKTLSCDMRRVQEMGNIKTDVGRARAWVRLALEKKLLSSHLKELLSDSYLLRNLYKRYAFLRCEDEREQFLYHLLSLNAMDYFCFTNAYTNTVVPYRVLIYPSLKFGCTTTSANPWITFAGHMGETGIIEIPKGVLEFCVEHKNLGVLTTLRIGHDNSGITPKWLIEYVLIRNEISGHTYKFVCGRWLGKGVEDGSIERLLVAELLSQNSQAGELLSAVTSPPRATSPVSVRSPAEPGTTGNLTIPDIQEMLGHAVNGLIKHFYRSEKERGNLTYLLCGDKGLVQCIELIFLYGFRSSRLFRNKFYTWDYLERVRSHLEPSMSREGGRRRTEAEVALFWALSSLLSKINEDAESVGKDGKFQIFVCVGIRDHTLQSWLPMIARNVITAQMYEEKSFMRDNDLITFITHILDTLNDFNIVLEPSLVRGLDI